MADSEEGGVPKCGKKPRKVNHVKMVVIQDLKSFMIDSVAEKNIESKYLVVSDRTKSHVNFPISKLGLMCSLLYYMYKKRIFLRV